MAGTPPGKYHLYAYVAQGSVFRLPDDQATTSFQWIFQRRPQGHRYAVAGIWDVTLHGDRYLVWDLLPDSGMNITNMQAPRPRLTHTDLDAAIIGSLMLYGSTCNNV